MKFRDIPQLTRAGSWEADYDLLRLPRVIYQFVTEEGLQLCPDFQRGHVWTEEQQISYVEFLLKGGKSARVIYLNNPSWHFPTKGTYNDFVCVDGLQRITALRRFADNELPVFGHFLKEYGDEPRGINTMRINVNDLKSKRDVLQWYIDFNAGGTVHSDAEIERVKALIAAEQ